jgi:predicted metal-dependent HD superfamily phosphohydrolase
MNKTKIISEFKKIVRNKINKNNKYHNYTHTLDVYNCCKMYSFLEDIDCEDALILKVAALFHDVIYFPERLDNEERSALFAEKILKRYDFSKKDILLVKKLILVTKMPVDPKTKLEKIICDSDLDNLGRLDFFKNNEKIRKEFKKSKKEYYSKYLINFLQSQKFHNFYAKKLRNKSFINNKKRIIELINKLNNPKKL